MTVGFDEATYAAINELAAREDVAVAWLVRRAVAEYVERYQAGRQMGLGLTAQRNEIPGSSK